MLLGNPHVPWNGMISFWHSRLTIPGKVDVDGVTLLGIPVVFNGYNRGVAWSATVSTAASYSLTKLKLVDRYTYLVDGEPERMIDRGTTGTPATARSPGSSARTRTSPATR